MDVNIQDVQFLDFEDVHGSEAEYLQTVLYSTRSPTLELPWNEEPPPENWSQQPQYESQPNELVDTGGGGANSGGNELYSMSVPVATTMQQLYHTSVVPQLPVTYGVPHPSYHPGLTQPPPVSPYQPNAPPQQMYSSSMASGRPRNKPSPKRGGGGGRDGSGGSPAAYPSIPPGPSYGPHPGYPPAIHVPFGCIPNTPPAHFTSAQHAAGHPLYITSSLGMYPPQHIYANYGVFSPMAQQPPEELKQLDYGMEKVDQPGAPIPPSSTPHNVYIAPQVPPPMQQPLPVMDEPSKVVSPPPPTPVKDQQYQHQMLKLQEGSATLEAEKSTGTVINKSQPPPSRSAAPTSPAATGSPAVTGNGPDKHGTHPIKSHPPKDAIITTAPPTLPPVKRKILHNDDHQPPQTNQQSPSSSPNPGPLHSAPLNEAPQPQPSVKVSSWADIVKQPESADRQHNCPPLNAVALSAPLAPFVTKHNSTVGGDLGSIIKDEQVDPLLKTLGEKLFKYELEHKSIVLIPRGLTNPSNYCYINATLQALLACPAFYNLIKLIADMKSAHCQSSKKESKTPVIDSMVQFIKSFQKAPPSRFKRNEKHQARKDTSTDAASLDMMTEPPFEPIFIYKMLRKMRSKDSFHEEGRQEDAEEFLSLLLNGLNDEMLELKKLVSDPSPIVNGDVTANGDPYDDKHLYKEVTSKGARVTTRTDLERTPLSDIFRGQLRCSTRRATSQETTDSVQPFFTLQLDIESSTTVSEALEKFVEHVLIDGDSTSDLSIRQQQTLAKLPCVLILHLKCFHYRQHTVSKVMKALEFPIDLRLDPRLLSTKMSNIKTRQYKLFAVVYHDGQEATKGHYLADVFHLGHSGWIRYDDASVKPVKEDVVLKPQPPRVPYLLYYRRADTIGLRTN